MKVIVGIPSRFGSTRFPGKPLKKILEKPLLEWVLNGVRRSEKVSKIVVATDHEEIFNLAVKLSVTAKMTASEIPSGTDRVWQVVKDEACDLVINVQGDEPLIEGPIIDELIKPFEKDPHLEMATLAKQLNPEAIHNYNRVKITLNRFDEALYFSRHPIPYAFDAKHNIGLEHIGIYAYRPSFLKTFCETPPVEIEKLERLEQLRALYLGAKIKVVVVNHESWGVDTPEDVVRVEEHLRKRQAHGTNPA